MDQPAEGTRVESSKGAAPYAAEGGAFMIGTFEGYTDLLRGAQLKVVGRPNS